MKSANQSPVILLRISGVVILLLGSAMICTANRGEVLSIFCVGAMLIFSGYLAIRARFLGVFPVFIVGIGMLVEAASGLFSYDNGGAVGTLNLWQGIFAWMAVGALFVSGSIQAFIHRKSMKWL